MAEAPPLSNFDVAHRFSELADSLEILGENQYKIRAYRNAASALEALPESIATVAAEDRLDDISGFGDAIRAKTKDILATGTTKALEDARRKVPTTALELLTLPGVGAKTVRDLISKLQIDSIASLEKALDEHRVRTIPGMSEKTEEKLRDAIERRGRYVARMMLSDAQELGETLVHSLTNQPEVGQASAAGSLRRGVDSIGDLDFVCESTDFEATLDAFASAPQVATVLSRGEHGERVALRKGPEVDLRLAAPGNYALLLHHFTGSRDHNIRLREMAEARGLKINEYGVWNVATNERLSLPDTEEAIYAILDLPFIPVPLRENRGEIEAAMEHRLPKLIVEADIKGDLHAHTKASDGKGTLEGMCITAKARGYAYMAITDHSQGLAIANGLTPERLRAQVKQVRAAEDEFGIRVFAGTECDIRPDGTMDFPDDLLKEMDIVIGSIHSRFQMTEAEMTARMLRAIENPNVDIIAHPTGRKINEREPYPINMDQIVAAAARTNTALEINSFPDRQDMNDVNARMAKDAGAPIVIDTDSHQPSHYSLIRFGVNIARRAWLEPKDVLNTLAEPEMAAWLRRDK
jgi:DNA polymerase (family 10)